MSLFALTVFFISPVLLGTKSLAALASPVGFSIATLLAIGATLLCRQGLPYLFGGDPDQVPLAGSRIAFTLLILGWGPLTAFQIANFPAVGTLVVSGSLGPVWSLLLPAGGLSLLKLAQTVALLFASLLAVITLWGVRQRFRKDQVEISAAAWLVLLGLFAGYLSCSLALVLGA